MTRSFWSGTIAPALRDLLAGLDAISKTLDVNRRIYWGLGSMGVVAPLSACVYLLFDRTVEDEAWYHLNYFHFFFLIGPHLFQFFCLIGAFLLFPENSKRAFTLIIPTGYVLAKILWLSSVTSNAEFWAVVPAAFVLTGFLISAVLFLMLNWLTWRQFHGADAYDARLKGIYRVSKDLPAEKVVSMFQQTMMEKEAFNTKF